MGAVESSPTPAEVVTTLGRLVSRTAGAAAKIGGTIGIHVLGDQGGRWTLDLATGTLADAPDARVSVDTLLVATPPAIRALFDGPEQLAFYRTTGQLDVRGNANKFTQLAELLGRQSSPLATRFPAKTRRSP